MVFENIAEECSAADIVPDSHLGTIEETGEGSTSGESAESALFEIPSKDVPVICDEQKRNKVEWIQEDDEDLEPLRPLKHPDVDGGWAWVVLVALFFIFSITTCLMASTALFYVHILEEFGHSRSYTSWIGSLMSSFYMLTGPIGFHVIKKFGCRAAVIVGSLLITIGSLMSAVAPSVSFLFFSYGTVIATGMNFAYSGQVVALVQYFDKYHGLATSLSMMGIGAGYFFLVPIFETIVEEYTWRGALLFSAGLGFQISVFGALIFPIKPLKEECDDSKDELLINCTQERTMNRSFSSANLSVGAIYLSTSLASFNVSRHMASNRNSFCSRGSHDVGLRSNQMSFRSDFAKSPFLRKGGFSFGSRGSHYTLQSSKSNLPSFCDNGSTIEKSIPVPHRPQSTTEDIQITRWEKIVKKLTLSLKTTLRNSFPKELFTNSIFWSFNISVFFIMLGTINLFVFYKDFSTSIGVDEYYIQAMLCIGLGDMIGRLGTGCFSSTRFFNAALVYSLSMLSCGTSILLLNTVNNRESFLIASCLFGLFYGSGNINLTTTPPALFGREQVVHVFGHLLFSSGLGALGGAPLAGFTVDLTGNYNAAILVSALSCFVASIFMFICYFISLRRPKDTLSSDWDTREEV